MPSRGDETPDRCSLSSNDDEDDEELAPIAVVVVVVAGCGVATTDDFLATTSAKFLGLIGSFLTTAVGGSLENNENSSLLFVGVGDKK